MERWTHERNGTVCEKGRKAAKFRATVLKFVPGGELPVMVTTKDNEGHMANLQTLGSWR